jgi:thiol-disulfide isomerase/thioredoxin
MATGTEEAGWSKVSRLGLMVMTISVVSLGVKLVLPPQSAIPPEFVKRQVPAVLPNVAFSDGEGHQQTLADYRGKVVLLNVWATWCPPCRKEVPSLDRLQAQLGGDDFEVIPLSVDRGGAEAVRRFFAANGVRHLAVEVDPSTEAQAALEIPGLPTTILINRQGREVSRFVGAADWDAPDAIAFLRAAIAEKNASANPFE